MNEIVIQQIKNFGYDYQEWEYESFKGLLCHNTQSKNEFCLVFLTVHDLIKKGLTTIETIQQSMSKYIVFILEIDYDFIENLEILDKVKDKPYISYLLFDPEDEIEFFMKDLWNVIVSINQQTKSNLLNV